MKKEGKEIETRHKGPKEKRKEIKTQFCFILQHNYLLFFGNISFQLYNFSHIF